MWDLQALSNKQCLVYHDPNVRSSVLYCLKGIFADLESAHDLTQTQRQTYLMHHAWSKRHGASSQTALDPTLVMTRFTSRRFSEVKPKTGHTL